MTKRILAALTLLIPSQLPAQNTPSTSIPLEDTKRSLLTRPPIPLTNFRLFLNYNAAEKFVVKFAISRSKSLLATTLPPN